MSSYEDRVLRVTDHVRRNLQADLSLGALAEVAHFSPYHFHRIFKAATGETLAAFVRRARLERATELMRGVPDRDLSSIALEVGFRTPSDLSRVFRDAYGIAPSRWDRRSRLDGLPHLADEIAPASGEPPEVVVRERPAARVIYVRVRDPWRGFDNLAEGYARLTRALGRRGVDWREAEVVGMSWDSELATPMERLVYDLGFAVGPDVEPPEGFGVHALRACTAVEVRCASLPEIALAWEHLYAAWLPASRHEPADMPALKRFCAVPETIDADAWRLDCSIALRSRHGLG